MKQQQADILDEANRIHEDAKKLKEVRNLYSFGLVLIEGKPRTGGGTERREAI